MSGCTFIHAVLVLAVFPVRSQIPIDDQTLRSIDAAARPFFAPCPSCGSFYSFDVASVHIVVLNPYTATGAGSLQHTWLVEVRQG